MKIDPDDDLKLWVAQENAKRHLALYEVTGNGLLIWKAFAEYRQSRPSLPVPENILAKLDEYGRRLQEAKGQAEIVEALELKNGKGGAQGSTLLEGQEGFRDLVEHYVIARMVNERLDASKRLKPGEIAKRTGEQFAKLKSKRTGKPVDALTGKNVQARLSQWKKDYRCDKPHAPTAEPADPTDLTIADLAVMFSRKS